MAHEWIIDDPKRMMDGALRDVWKLARLLRAECDYRCEIGDMAEDDDANRIFAQYETKLEQLRAVMAVSEARDITDVRMKVQLILDDMATAAVERRDVRLIHKDILESVSRDCCNLSPGQPLTRVA